jgi:N-acetylornithine carbamoyltransferase
MKVFNDLADFSVDEIGELLRLANYLESHPQPTALSGKVLALLFLSPSLRTLASFQAAMTRLGGGSIVISPDMSIHGLETRPGIVMDGVAAEHIREAVPVIASYADAIGIRAFGLRKNLADDLADKDFHAMTALTDTPYINMESACNHPCQSLADWKTLDEVHEGVADKKFVLSWSYHPKSLPLAVPAATLHMAAMRGMKVTVLRPDGFALPAPLMEKAQAAAKLSGGSVTETNNREDALQDASILYVKSWAATDDYGNASEDMNLRRELHDWRIDEDWFSNARSDCRLMHCLPVRRDVEICENVLDGPRSIVIPQARNRMLAQMAVLHEMLGKR